MDITEVLSSKYTEFDIGTPLLKVAGPSRTESWTASS